MACILTFIEQRDGSVRKASLEALSEARRLAAAGGFEVCAVLVGHGVADKAAELGRNGAAKVYVADGEKLARYSSEGYAEAVKLIVRFDKPVLVTGGGGYHVENTVRGWTLAWSILCGDDTGEDARMGLGGVMLENADWLGGLRDRMLLTDGGRRDTVDADMAVTVQRLRSTLFPLHGL